MKEKWEKEEEKEEEMRDAVYIIQILSYILS